MRQWVRMPVSRERRFSVGWVRERATRAFRLLGDAEGQVHGLPWDRVALHEVGALDALVDIVGSIEGFEQLGITEVSARPVAFGDGWVKAAHGVLPVPAPATAVLAEGLRIAPNGPVQGDFAPNSTASTLLKPIPQGSAFFFHTKMTEKSVLIRKPMEDSFCF